MYSSGMCPLRFIDEMRRKKMLNTFCKRPHYAVTRQLAMTAMGTRKADLVIRNARLVNVCTAEIQ